MFIKYSDVVHELANSLPSVVMDSVSSFQRAIEVITGLYIGHFTVSSALEAASDSGAPLTGWKKHW